MSRSVMPERKWHCWDWCGKCVVDDNHIVLGKTFLSTSADTILMTRPLPIKAYKELVFLKKKKTLEHLSYTWHSFYMPHFNRIRWTSVSKQKDSIAVKMLSFFHLGRRQSLNFMPSWYLIILFSSFSHYFP